MNSWAELAIWASDSGDCDDASEFVHPGAIEDPADGVDNDCDGRVDEGAEVDDADFDGVTEEDGDCDDSNPHISPDAEEVCTTIGDAVDENCDGVIDEGCEDDDTGTTQQDTGCSTTGGSPGGAMLLLSGVVALLGRRRGVLVALAAAGCGGDILLSVQDRQGEIAGESEIDFGNVTVGHETTQVITLRNQGDALIEVSRLWFESDEAWTIDPIEQSELAESGDDDGEDYLDLTVRWTPEEVGAGENTLNVDLVSAQFQSVPITLYGVAVPVHMRVQPPIIRIDTDNGASAVFYNDGDAEINIADMSIDSAFSVVDFDVTALEAEGAETFFITLEDTGVDTGTLTISTPDGTEILVPIYVEDCDHPIESIDADGDGFTACAGDCDDGDDAIHPAAIETENSVDDDCDGDTDEGTDAYDDDGDGYTEDAGDCHDGNDQVYPGSTAEISGVDADCDGTLLAEDIDGDGYSVDGGDCDDTDSAIHPGAVELPNAVNDDCDGWTDEGTVNFDDDLDSFTEGDGDCDDGDATRYPGATELPDGTDDDCDGSVDEGTVLFDDDGDGFTENGNDCDDTDAAIGPHATDTLGDGIDQDCSGSDG